MEGKRVSIICTALTTFFEVFDEVVLALELFCELLHSDELIVRALGTGWDEIGIDHVM